MVICYVIFGKREDHGIIRECNVICDSASDIGFDLTYVMLIAHICDHVTEVSGMLIIFQVEIIKFRTEKLCGIFITEFFISLYTGFKTESSPVGQHETKPYQLIFCLYRFLIK